MEAQVYISREAPSAKAPSIRRSACFRLAAACAVVALAVAGCGTASPQGLDDLGGRPLNLTIRPQDSTLAAGDRLQFSLWSDNEVYLHSSIQWSATGGTISTRGLYTAGTTPGRFQVTAKVRGFVATSAVTIEESQLAPPPSNGPSSSDPSDDDSPSDPEDPSEPEDPPPSTSRAFSDGFETNDFRNWGSWAPLNDPTATGRGGGGAHIGDGYITSERTRSGNRAWKAFVDPATSNSPVGKSSLERARVLDGVRDFTVSAWYYFPSDYPSVWSNIMQIKERQSPFNPTAVVAIGRDGQILLYEGLDSGSTLEKTSAVVPKGRWVQIKTRFVISRTNGRVTVWLDGRQVLDRGGFNTLGHDGTTDVYFGVGNYISANDLTRCHAFIDDVEVTY